MGRAGKTSYNQTLVLLGRLLAIVEFELKNTCSTACGFVVGWCCREPRTKYGKLEGPPGILLAMFTNQP